MANEQYKFPDELEDSKAKGGQVEDEIEIDIEDDTPEDDRNKAPLPKEIAEELYNDELEDYSSKVKKKLVQLKKLAHDERREKEAVQREQAEAVNLAKRLIEENNRLKSNLNNSEKHVLESVKRSVEMEMADAEREYREAYESGDSEKLLAAQKKLNSASIKVEKVSNFKPPSLQEEKYEVQTTQRTAQTIPVDTKAQSWQKENSWFGEDKLMTGMALALHEVLKEEGVALSSAEYYRRINETMRQRFPEKFQDQLEDDNQRTGNRSTKPSLVVAPATRSTSSKRISLTRSQLGIAKKLNLTPEQYAHAVLKLEA
jgi:uncharacterized protein (UPF0335 family)